MEANAKKHVTFILIRMIWDNGNYGGYSKKKWTHRVFSGYTRNIPRQLETYVFSSFSPSRSFIRLGDHQRPLIRYCNCIDGFALLADGCASIVQTKAMFSHFPLTIKRRTRMFDTIWPAVFRMAINSNQYWMGLPFCLKEQFWKHLTL